MPVQNVGLRDKTAVIDLNTNVVKVSVNEIDRHEFEIIIFEQGTIASDIDWSIRNASMYNKKTERPFTCKYICISKSCICIY